MPTLDQTLLKYLDSIRPHVTQEEFLVTEKIVKQFENGLGQRLQRKLEEKGANEKNWVY